MTETRKVVCKYSVFENVVQEYALFGWNLNNKILLNRFGSPVPLGVTFDENDLKEKCSYELYFTRIVNSKSTPSLNELQNRYNSLELEPTKFSKGRISGIVWLSIICSVFLVYFFMSITEKAYSIAGICLIPILLTIGGCVTIILTGNKRISKAKKKNEEILLEKQKLVLLAKEILKEDAIATTQNEEKNVFSCEKMFCKYCGAQIDNNSVFCNRCGKQQ